MNHDSPNTPVFLRFINMIVNDAIVQLDEALQVCYTCANISTFIISLPLYVKSVATIREEELLKDSGEWERESSDEKGDAWIYSKRYIPMNSYVYHPHCQVES